MSSFTLEDCLELLTGLNALEGYTFALEKEDYNILTSVARQVFKGVALTDRQFDMLVRKFEKYTMQFEKNGIDISNIIEKQILRHPFREVDRTQRIYIENDLIVAQFPFNKKLISKIEKFRAEASGQVTNNKNKWKFELSERNVRVVGETLSKFVFSDEFKALYDVVKEYKYEDYVPGIYQEDSKYVLKNIHPSALQNAQNECGDFDQNILKYVDRRYQYGIVHCDVEDETNTLTNKIAFRKGTSLIVNDTHSIDAVTTAINTLDRYPLVVVVDEDKVEALYDVYHSISRHVSTQEQTVMFRLSNETDKDRSFNLWIKENNLNNWLDKDTKVVYISSNKVPKPVVKNCEPQCVLSIANGIRSYGSKHMWVNNITDLKISYAIEPWDKKNLEVIE